MATEKANPSIVKRALEVRLSTRPAASSLPRAERMRARSVPTRS
jgi:hypothetical protein